MKVLVRKITAMTFIAAFAVTAMSFTVASATTKKGCNESCGSLCYNKWEYDSSAKSNFYNDTHAHRSTVKVGSSYYYSGTGSSDYNAAANETSYASKSKPWYNSYHCYYDAKDCAEGAWIK